jgi:hypothetical protein
MMLAPGNPNRVALENQLVALAQAGRLVVNMNSQSIVNSAPPWRAQIIQSVNNAINNATPAALYIHHFNGNITILPPPVVVPVIGHHAAAAAEMYEGGPCMHCGAPQQGRWRRHGNDIVLDGL